MPWHERWFYLDWLRDEAAESDERNAAQAFADGMSDPRQSASSGLGSFDFEALGATVNVI